jgi:hypothetical protein
MHLTITAFIILIVYHRGVWKDWKQYHPTMLFFGLMELVYNCIVKENNYFLWKITPDIFCTRIPLLCLYSFIIFPLTALLFLSNLPQKISKQILHIAKWCCIYILFEGIVSIFNRIDYFNGWSLLHSFIFDIILFCGLILHHKKPLIAYIIFILTTFIGIWAYNIPI